MRNYSLTLPMTKSQPKWISKDGETQPAEGLKIYGKDF